MGNNKRGPKPPQHRTVDLPEIMLEGRPATATEVQVARMRARTALAAPTDEAFEAELATLDPFVADVARWSRALRGLPS
jgi:hypothetical protein